MLLGPSDGICLPIEVLDCFGCPSKDDGPLQVAIGFTAAASLPARSPVLEKSKCILDLMKVDIIGSVEWKAKERENA